MKKTNLISILGTIPIVSLWFFCTAFLTPFGFAADEIYLGYVTSTRTQIVLKWNANWEETPLGFELQRATSSDFSDAVAMTLPPDINVYSDTGYDPNDRRRFTNTNLSKGVKYLYRIRAVFSSSYSEFSNAVSGSLTCPIRGVEGDLWADAVLGQPDFYQNSRGRTTALATDICGGLWIDRSATPERAYVVDTNHSRILGFSNIGNIPWEPDLVIGQPDYESGAPNRVATAPCYPELSLPAADSLALVRPTQISVGEAVLFDQLVVDASGNLFVADVSNHRILMYEDPFITDAIADDVWGQPNFESRVENYGGRSASSLFFYLGHTNTGLTFGPDGALWVADSGNYRVLRFPRDGMGNLQKTADLVLGQSSFTGLSPGWIPSAVQVDDSGVVYIAWLQHDTGNPSKISAYEPPLYNGKPATRTLADNSVTPDFRRPNYLVLDPLGRGLWMQSYVQAGSSNCVTRLMDPSDGTVLSSLETKDSRGFAVDREGTLYIHQMDEDISRFPEPYGIKNKTFLFSDRWILSGQDFWQLKGMTTFGDQFIVCEAERLLIWDDYRSLTTYDQASDVWGQVDFSSNDRTKIFLMGFPQVDELNRLWVFGRFQDLGWGPSFKAFNYPLTKNSVPTKTLLDSFELVDRSGTITLASPPEPLHFACTDQGDQMWIADWQNSRVIRVNNIEGNNDSSRDEYVDVVLGQPDATSTSRNQGAGLGHPQRTSLDLARYVSIGGDGNLYVSDNSGEGGTNCRILVFDMSLFPDYVSSVLYAVPATDVIGTGGAFDVQGCIDETCAPLQTGFSRMEQMVFGSSAYNNNNQYYPVAFLDPASRHRPDFALGDYGAIYRYSFFDDFGNLYLGDYGWARILIYKRPFLHFDPSSSGLDSSFSLY